MTHNDPFIGQLEDYLEEFEGSTPLPESVRDAIRAELPSTRQRPPWWPARRFPPMSNTVRIALATAAVVVFAFLGIRFLGLGTNIGGPSETATPIPTPTPVAFSDLNGAIPPGPVILDGAFPLAIEFDVPIFWSADAAAEVADQVSLSRVRGDMTPVWVEFSIVGNAFPDPCRPVGMDPQLGPTVDDLVSALTSMAGTEAGAVTDVQVDGYAGKRFDLTTTVVPADAGCDDLTWLSLWRGTGETIVVVPGPTNMRFTVVDVDGTRLVIWTQSFGTDPSTTAELEEAYAIIDSVRFR